jgi:hypothetical protein
MSSYNVTEDGNKKILSWEIIDGHCIEGGVENTPSLQEMIEVAKEEFPGVPSIYLVISGDDEGVYLEGHFNEKEQGHE